MILPCEKNSPRISWLNTKRETGSVCNHTQTSKLGQLLSPLLSFSLIPLLSSPLSSPLLSLLCSPLLSLLLTNSLFSSIFLLCSINKTNHSLRGSSRRRQISFTPELCRPGQRWHTSNRRLKEQKDRLQERKRTCFVLLVGRIELCGEFTSFGLRTEKRSPSPSQIPDLSVHSDFTYQWFPTVTKRRKTRGTPLKGLD